MQCLPGLGMLSRLFGTLDRSAPTPAPVIEVFPVFPVQTILIQVSYFSLITHVMN